MKAETRALWLAVACGVLFWVADAVLDYCFFYQGGFWEILITDLPAHEAYSRSLAMVLFVGVGLALSVLAPRRKQAEDRIIHLNAVLRAIRNVNQLIVAQRNSDRLLEGACECLVETRGYHWAWIALLDDDGSSTKAFERGLGANWSPLRELLQQGELTQCMRTALHQAETVVAEDVLATCGDCPLSGVYGQRAGMAVRLEHAGRVHGTLTVSIPRAMSTSDEEQELLKEVAGDLALALHGIRADEERKQAQEALARSERLYREAIESAAGVPYRRNAATNSFDFLGSGVEALLGIPPEQVSPETLRAMVREVIVRDPTAPGEISEYDRLFRQGEVEQFRVDYGMTTAAGEEKWISDCATPIRDRETSEVISSLGILQDITDRVMAERAVRESEQRFRDVALSSSDWVWEVDAQGRYTYCSERVGEVLGYPPEELVGKTPFNLMPTKEANGIRSEFERLAANHEPIVDLENWNLAKDGRPVCLLTNGVLIFGPDGDFAGYRGVHKDITEQRKAAEALRESEERYRTLVETMGDGLTMIDSNAIITYANDAFCQMLGYEPDEVIGKPLPDLCDEVNRPALESQLARRFRNGVEADYELHYTAKSGRQVPVVISATPMRDKDDRIAGAFAVIKDLTQRRQAEDAQRLASLGQLASGIGHEFNNVLAAMRMSAELAQMRPDEERYRELAETVLRGTSRGADIGKNLMRFGMPEQPIREPILIETPIEAALAMASRELENAEVAVRRDYAALGRSVHADPNQLEQVFLNLIINACHAMPHGGELTIRTRHVPQPVGAGELLVTVTDTGTGIQPDHLDRIFEPFFTTKGGLGGSDIPGAGLGLSVSHGIIKAHNGEINVDSRLGGGATFQIRLQEYEKPPAKQAPPDTATTPLPESKHTGARVLVAEDEEDIRTAVHDALAMSGYEVVSVASCDRAIDALHAQEFDIIVADLLMPGGGGRAVIAAARQLDEPPPVLIMTGQGEERIADELAALGAALCLRKPLELADLLDSIEGLLGQREGPSNPPQPA